MNTARMQVLEVSNGDKNKTIYPVVLQDSKEMILIDAGYPNQVMQFQDSAKKQGVNLAKLTKVIISHHDFDHIGSLAALKRTYPHIKVCTSQYDKPPIEGVIKSQRLKQIERIHAKTMKERKVREALVAESLSFQSLLASIETTSVDMVINDGFYLPECGGIQVIATPGHMPEHLSFYIEQHKAFVTGDCLVLYNGQLDVPSPQYAFNLNQAVDSIEKVMEYDIETLICYHGGIYQGNIKQALSELTCKYRYES